MVGTKEKRDGKVVNIIIPGTSSSLISDGQKKVQLVLRTRRVMLTVAPESQTKYGDLMEKARSVELKDLGISDLRCWHAVTEGIVLEIPRKESGARAKALASKLKDVFQGREEIRVTRPVKAAEIRLSGLDDSITIRR